MNDQFNRRALICLSFCRRTRRTDGATVVCAFSGQSIHSHCEAGGCGNLQEDQFEKFAGNVAGLNASPVSASRPPSPSLFSWAIAGPLLWRELHIWALTAKLAPDGIGVDVGAAGIWLRDFTARIACGECRDHWKAMIAGHPPDFSSRDALFKWTAERHNSVNERLGKTAMPLDDARRIWTAAAIKPMIVTKGCGGCGG